MNPRPTQIQLDGPHHLVIDWSDGQKRRYLLQEFLDKCPCANCREKRQGAKPASADLLPVIKAEEMQPLKLQAMQPVGQYAYSLTFNHGCPNGIFTFEHLRELGQEVK